MAKKRVKIFAGILIWSGVLFSLYHWAYSQPVGDGTVADRLVPQAWDYVTSKRTPLKFESQVDVQLAVGDPVFAVDASGESHQVGEVTQLDPIPNTRGVAIHARKGQVLLYADAPVAVQGSVLISHQAPRSMSWVLETMLPPHKRAEVTTEIRQAFRKHQSEIIAALKPIMARSLQQAYEIVKEDLPVSLAAHQAEIQAIGKRYEKEIVQSEIVPLVKKEIWPIVKEQSQPIVTEVGKEIWQKASVWRFGWRYAYDKSFRPNESLVKEEWDRFVKDDATPVLEEHTNDFIALQKTILSDIAANKVVQAKIEANLGKIVSDPEMKKLVWSIIREVIVDNPRVKQVMEENWSSPEANAAFQLASSRLEPTAVRIGQILFGDEDAGITPEFAKVLRNQILQKDQRWLVLETDTFGNDSTEPIRNLPLLVGDVPRINPFASQIQLTRSQQ
ncbi:MAG: hypothetical protein ACI9G1_003841 [Pirellulaceae bacterium]|jgi:hypothetical protein